MTTPITDRKTATVDIPLLSEILLKFGFPRILNSDNGMEFQCTPIEHLTQQMGIKKTYISPNTPNAMEN